MTHFNRESSANRIRLARFIIHPSEIKKKLEDNYTGERFHIMSIISFQNSDTPSWKCPTASLADRSAIPKMSSGAVGCLIALHLTKNSFVGKMALFSREDRSDRHFVTLKVEVPDVTVEVGDPLYLSSLIQEDKPVALIPLGG